MKHKITGISRLFDFSKNSNLKLLGDGKKHACRAVQVITEARSILKSFSIDISAEFVLIFCA